MKTKHMLAAILIFCGIIFTGLQSRAQTTSVKIHLSNIRSSSGDLHLGFFRAKDDFPAFGKHSFTVAASPNGTDSLTVTVPKVAIGEYAIAVYQDVNGNGKLDTKMFGIPKEPYAFSQNYHPKLSKPGFKDCKISVTEKNKEFAIKLIQ